MLIPLQDLGPGGRRGGGGKARAAVPAGPARRQAPRPRAGRFPSPVAPPREEGPPLQSRPGEGENANKDWAAGAQAREPSLPEPSLPACSSESWAPGAGRWRVLPVFPPHPTGGS